MTPELSGAIQDLYAVFRRYRSVSFEGCPDCTSPAETARLAAPLLRELNPDDLARYAFKAMTTWGTIDDFKHFLPRIFDLLAQTGGGSWIEPEIVFGKLPYGKWTTWPRRERDALLAYMDALWNDILARFPHPFEADSCLCGIALAVDDLSPYLTAWPNSTDLPALLHFVEFARWNVPDRHHKSLTNAWWRERTAQAKQVAAWLVDTARDDWLTAAMLRFGDDDAIAAELAEAMTNVEIIRAGYAGAP